MLRSHRDGHAYGLSQRDNCQETEKTALDMEGDQLGYIV